MMGCKNGYVGHSAGCQTELNKSWPHCLRMCFPPSPQVEQGGEYILLPAHGLLTSAEAAVSHAGAAGPPSIRQSCPGMPPAGAACEPQAVRNGARGASFGGGSKRRGGNHTGGGSKGGA